MMEYARVFRVRIRQHGESSRMTIRDLEENKIIFNRESATSDGLQEALHTLRVQGFDIQSHFFYKNDIFLISK